MLTQLAPRVRRPTQSEIPQAPARLTLSRVATLVLVVAMTAVATWTLLLAPGSGSLESLEVRLVYDGIAVAALVPWLAIAVMRPTWLPSTRLAPALVTCIAAFVIATAFSRVPRLSMEGLGYAILLAEAYLLVVSVLRVPELRRHMHMLALLVCGLASVLYLVQVVFSWSAWWDSVGRLTLPPLRPEYLGLAFGSPNPVATLVLTLAAFGLATASIRRSRIGTVAVAGFLALVAVATLLTGSRGAWLGAAVGIAVAGTAALATEPALRRAAARFVRSRKGTVASIVAVTIVLAAGGVAAASGRLSLADDGLRAAFAAASLRMFEASPLVGVGPGTWQVLRAAYTTPAQPDYYIPHAHNVFLQTVAEFGVVGAVAGLVLAASLALLIVTALRSEDGGRRRVALAALFAVVLFAGQQLADMLMNVPALLFAVTLPIAWLDATAPASRTGVPSWMPRLPRLCGVPWAGSVRRVLVAAMLVATCVIVVGLAGVESATAPDVQAVSAADGGDWGSATPPARQAASIDPDLAIYSFTLGIAAANTGDLPLAAASLERSATADDYAYAWLDLAAVRWRLGDVSAARDALVRAERLGRQRAPDAVAAGWLRQQLGDADAAVADYTSAIASTPGLAADPFWKSASAALGRDVLALASSRADRSTAVLIGLTAARTDLTSAAFARLPASDQGLYRLVIDAWDRNAAAWDRLQQQAASRPLDGATVQLASFVASGLDDAQAEARYATWLAIETTAKPQFPRIEFGSPLPLPSSDLDRYGSLYRRPVPDAQIVGILPQLDWRDEP